MDPLLTSKTAAVSVDQKLAALLEQAAQQLQRGESVDLTRLAEEHPSHADAVRDLLPTVAAMIGMTRKAADENLDQSGLLSKYQLMAKLGEGGMGAVYMAMHTELQKIVALKVLPSSRMNDSNAVARFRREMRAAGRLDHPNIVRASDAGEEQGRHFLVMEYVDGCDLSRLVRRIGPLPIADAAEIIKQTAQGLEFAHRSGLVHRDVKPSNIMVTRQGDVKILDLGLALLEDQHHADLADLTNTGQMIGTLDYMAPEQGSNSHAIDARVDVYSMGATLYQLLAGTAPFAEAQFDTVMKKLNALASQPAAPLDEIRPEIPKELAASVAKMLAKNPNDRFATAAEVSSAVAPFSDGSNVAALLLAASIVSAQPAVDASAISTSNQFRSLVLDSTIDSGRHTANPLLTAPAAPPSRRRRWLAIAAAMIVPMIVAGVILIVRDKNGEEKLRAPLEKDDTISVVEQDGTPPDREENPFQVESESLAGALLPLVHVKATIIGSGKENRAGVPLPDGPVFDSSRPHLPLPRDAGPADKLNITRMFYCREDSVSTGPRSARYRPVDLFVPVPDEIFAQVDLGRTKDNVQFIVPTRDLPDGVYCLHTGKFSGESGAVAPQYCAPFLVRGYGQPETGDVTVTPQGKGVKLSVKIKNKGKGAFDDGFIVMTLQKGGGESSEFKGRNHLKLKTIPPNGEVESSIVWDMSDMSPGTYYFRGHVNYNYLWDVNTLCDIESERFEWTSRANSNKRSPAADEENPFQEKSADEDIAIYFGCGDAGKPGVVHQVSPIGKITGTLKIFAPPGVAFRGNSLVVTACGSYVGGGQTLVANADGKLDRVPWSKQFPTPAADTVDFKTQDLIIADSEENTVSRISYPNDEINLLFRTPLESKTKHYPGISLASTADGHVLFSASDPKGVFRVPPGATELPKPLLKEYFRLAAVPGTNRWVAMSRDELRVFEGSDHKETIPAPAGSVFWSNLAFAPSGRLFTVLQTGSGIEIQSMDLNEKKFKSQFVWSGGDIVRMAVGRPLPWKNSE